MLDMTVSYETPLDFILLNVRHVVTSLNFYVSPSFFYVKPIVNSNLDLIWTTKFKQF